jgi:hypothetical protein
VERASDDRGRTAGGGVEDESGRRGPGSFGLEDGDGGNDDPSGSRDFHAGEMLSQTREAGLDLDRLVGVPVDGVRGETGDLVDLLTNAGVVRKPALGEIRRVVVLGRRDDQLGCEDGEGNDGPQTGSNAPRGKESPTHRVSG